MRGKRNILRIAALALSALAIPAVIAADTPAGTLRFFGISANPSGEFSGDIVGIPTVIEAGSTAGFGVTYEVRTSDLLGLEFGILGADFDFDLSAMETTAEFGSALMLPATVGLNLHVLRGDRLGLHLGPLVTYTAWGDLESDFGTSALDSSFDFGINVGLDASMGSSGWAVHVGAIYLDSAAGDSSIEIDVNPVMIQLGLAKSF